MAFILSRYFKYVSILALIFSILYQYEIPTESSNKKTLLVRKNSTLQYNRSHVYNIITNIDKYPAWYPNIARVEHIQLKSKNHEGDKYRLITRFPIIGDISSTLVIQKYDRPKQFIYSINSWTLETNSIEFKDDKKDGNITYIQWSVYTKRRSYLFQYLLLPFAKFYKNQLVREALFSLMIQIRHL